MSCFVIIFLIPQQEPDLKAAAAIDSVAHGPFHRITAAASPEESSVWKQFFGAIIFIFVSSFWFHQVLISRSNAASPHVNLDPSDNALNCSGITWSLLIGVGVVLQSVAGALRRSRR